MIDIRYDSNVASINDNKVMLYNGKILRSNNIPIFTGQPDALTILTGIDYISSFIPYTALRIYIPYNGECKVGYSTELPLRKIQTIGNALLIYCDSQLSLIENKKYKIIMHWIAIITGIHITINDMKKLIYKFWTNGIYFYRPYKNKIRTDLMYINGDISNRPGWIEGSLELVEQYMSII